MESVNQVDVDLRDEKEAVFLGRCRHGRFQVAYSVHPGARKRTKSGVTDRVVDLCFLLNHKSRVALQVEVPQIR